MEELDASAVRGKITVVRAFSLTFQLPGSDGELTSVTFCIMDEDHTMGNALRYMLMKDPRVEFCGYTLPHPSENKIHLRVQMQERTVSAVDALRDALGQLDTVFSTIEERYRESQAAGHVSKEPAPQPSVSLRTQFSA
ncbi:RNA polymerase subunit AC19 [Malassezia equina]|uniref:DNA-directed RNA polymerases I and III subunit RPAC2 n=1 Tax=Malassezia equina TaxID=1381935 RepID=A0AAF0IXW4_9BASI|nr:RNA polymerase subunit AC19 [Malassezia equina]